MIDPAALARIRSLELRAKVIVEGFWSGLHRSPYHGFSVEFSEFRQYAPGDDLRHVDWRIFARRDRYFIRKHEDETSLRCRLLLDQSRSMRFRSGDNGLSKEEYARTLAATLAWFLNSQGDAVGLTVFSGSVDDAIPPRHRPGHLRRLLLILERASEGRASSLGEPLRRIAEASRRRGLFVLISDLLAPIDDLELRLGCLRARGHDAVVFQVFDPAEATFDFAKPLFFTDSESGREMFIDPRSAKDEYARRFAAHQKAVGEICRRQGIDFHPLSTDRPLELALHDFLAARRAAVGRSAASSRNRALR